MQFTFEVYKCDTLRPLGSKDEMTTKNTHHWEAGTITDGEVTLQTKGEEHFSQLLL